MAMIEATDTRVDRGYSTRRLRSFLVHKNATKKR